jgi:hypothetical protein
MVIFKLHIGKNIYTLIKKLSPDQIRAVRRKRYLANIKEERRKGRIRSKKWREQHNL